MKKLPLTLGVVGLAIVAFLQLRPLVHFRGGLGVFHQAFQSGIAATPLNSEQKRAYDDAMEKAQRAYAFEKASYRTDGGMSVVVLLLFSTALLVVGLRSPKSGSPNKTPLPTPVECPPSNHDQVPGAADL